MDVEVDLGARIPMRFEMRAFVGKGGVRWCLGVTYDLYICTRLDKVPSLSLSLSDRARASLSRSTTRLHTCVRPNLRIASVAMYPRRTHIREIDHRTRRRDRDDARTYVPYRGEEGRRRRVTNFSVCAFRFSWRAHRRWQFLLAVGWPPACTTA